MVGEKPALENGDNLKVCCQYSIPGSSKQVASILVLCAIRYGQDYLGLYSIGRTNIGLLNICLGSRLTVYLPKSVPLCLEKKAVTPFN